MNGRVIELKNRPAVIASAAAVGKTEGEGPLRDEFDVVFRDDGIQQSSWENAESELMFVAVNKCLEKAGLAAFAHGEYFELGKKLGTFGFSAKKKKKPHSKK